MTNLNRVVAKFIALLFAIFLASAAIAQQSTCENNLELLRQDLVSMLNKMTAMPPIATIYKPTRELYEEAKAARDRGDYSTCVNKSALALKYSKPYGNRY